MASENITRRSFAGIGMTAAAGLGLAAAHLTNARADEAVDEAPAWNKEADVVVVGYGGAGAAAAIEAARAGARVIVLEELENPGGATAVCGGSILMADTPLQKKFGLEDSVDAMYDYLCASGGASANQELLRVLADFSPELYEWCVGCGMDFEGGELYPGPHINSFNKTGYTLFYTGNEQSRELAAATPPVPRGHSTLPDSNGASLFAALSAVVDTLGVEVLLGTPARSLVTDAEGRVVGVLAEGPEGPVAVGASKAVVLTAGGFIDNPQMVADTFPFTNPSGGLRISAGNENGSGILMGQAVGAATRGMACYQVGRPLSTMSDLLPRGVILTEYGARIVAEDEYNSFIGKALMGAPTANCFLIVDEQVETEGNPARFLGEAVAVCEAIDEIAPVIGCDPAVLANTFAFYNESVALGVDREFGKDPQFLVEMATGPFYVHTCGSKNCMFGSLGGIAIDAGAHALDLDGRPIPGLYAAGRNSGSIFGWYMASGASVADVLTFGIFAGRNAAAEA